jgi:hypothetical protein
VAGCSSPKHAFTSGLTGDWTYHGPASRSSYTVSFTAVAGEPHTYSIKAVSGATDPCKGVEEGCHGAMVGSTFKMEHGFSLRDGVGGLRVGDLQQQGCVEPRWAGVRRPCHLHAIRA